MSATTPHPIPVPRTLAGTTVREQLACDLAPQPGPDGSALHRYLAGFRVGSTSVGSADLVVLPRWDQAAFDALDDSSWDLAALSHLLRRGYHEILTELHGQDPRDDATGPVPPPGIVLVDRVSVEAPWRGRALGLLGTGLALRGLRTGAAFALLYPMVPGLASEAARSESHRSLTRYWSRLGFTHAYEHHLVLDLATDDLDAALDRVLGRRESSAAPSPR